MKKAAVIGSPVRHSLSPALHNYWCQKHGIPGVYEAIEVEEKDLDAFLDRIRGGEFVGANVTAPLKEVVFEKMDKLDDTAVKTGAVNTIVAKTGGVLEGRNTDPEGFMETLMFHTPDFDFNNTKAIILGAGGAAKACVHALLEKKVGDILVAGRTAPKLAQLIDFYATPSVRGGLLNSLGPDLSETTLLVNATPVGPGVNFSLLPKQAVVCDLGYNPVETNFLKTAGRTGLKTIDGLGMLGRQAIPAFEAWFGVRPQFDFKTLDVLKHIQTTGMI